MISKPNYPVGDATGRRVLMEADAKALLVARGIPTPAFRLVGSPEEAAEAATALGFPVAVKVASPDILHKSDVGGVILNVSTPEEAFQAFDRVVTSARTARPNAHVCAALVEEMCSPGGVEMIVGLVMDPTFGPVVMLGLGGVFVESLKDVVFRIAPITRADGHAMLSDLQGKWLLDGARGRPPIDKDALVDLLVAVAGPEGMASGFNGQSVAELDLNPVLAYPSGLKVADARLVLVPEVPQKPSSGDMHELEQLMRVVFAPNSIAVVGASTNELKHGGRTIRNLVRFGYSGDLYPIHPSAAEIWGRRVYRTLADTPDPVERAIVTLPKVMVPDIISQCVEKGVRVAHVYTAGFGELDAAGRELEREVLSRAAGSQLRIIGPNCLGTYCPKGGLTLTMGTTQESGHVSTVSQSGGLMVDMVRRGGHQGLRFSKAISIGNSIDLEPPDFLEYYANDPETRVMGAYIESVRDGRRLRRALETAADNGKPVVVLKGGRTSAGLQAAASHTGALASDFAIWHGLFQQLGVTSVETIEEMLDILLGFQLLKVPQGSGVALVGQGGGANVTSSDAADRYGLSVPRFSRETVGRLRALNLPPGTSLLNPLDTPGSMLRMEEGSLLARLLPHAAADPAVDAVVVHLNLSVTLAHASLEITSRFVHNMVTAVASFAPQSGLPVLLVLRSTGELEHEELVQAESKRALDAGIPVYRGVEDALRVLGHMHRYACFRRRWLSV